LKLYYYLFILLVYIDITFSLFIASKDEILITNNANFFAREEDWMTSVGYKYSVWTSTWR